MVNNAPAVMCDKGMHVIALLVMEAELICTNPMCARHVIRDEAIGERWTQGQETIDNMGAQ